MKIKSLFLGLLFCSTMYSFENKHIVVVTCSFNNIKYFSKNLKSIFSQTYSNYTLIYIDDCSNDGTYDAVKKYVADNRMEDKIVLIHNQDKKTALANLYYGIHQCRAADIIVIVDGDDWLSQEKVISRVNEIYNDSNIWLTYGQFQEYPSEERGFCRPYPPHIANNNGFRYFGSTPSHLRTFYAGLFHQIRKEDLMFQGEFFPTCYDLAIMFPMIEMARKHWKFIPEILLIYNNENPINDHKKDKKIQRKFDLIIRARTCYNELESLMPPKWK